MVSKHFVIVHETFHGKWNWEGFKTRLEAAGHLVTTFDLKASGDDPTPIESVASADEYATPLLDVLKDIPMDDKVILVGHGFGSISAAIAMDKYPKKVELAVFLNAVIPDTTHRPSYVLEEVFTDWEDCEFGCYNINKGAISTIKLGPNFVMDHLYNLSPDKDILHAMRKLRKGTFFLEPLAIREKFTEEGYGSIPKVVISCLQDTWIPSQFQNWEMEKFNVKKPYTLDGDHMPMYSNPEELLNIFNDIANSIF